MRIIEDLDKEVQHLFKKIVSYHFDESTKSLPSGARMKQIKAWIEKYASEQIKSKKED